ncbi:hypothetical protein ACUXAV_006550 [Cupriavidus metallidurans]|uniref:hypothetical protein n=1 Tax=Cupriavidus TaxID=106589 RepID=UPI0004932B59|nr:MULTISPECIES: hypothetical protein [Cupriavidus]KWR70525.1 hypothetical protein RN01_32300 [Cupriavidus sp. SHE]MDE4920261.1 hypothetical protein [Cupriavidus metallidurans]GMG94547.1 hypothetical protein Cmtc_57670 [Cupriavidus sp. TKC]
MKKTHTAILTAALSILAGSAIAAPAEGQVHRPRDPFTDGARAGASATDVYAGGGRIDKRDVFTDGARIGTRDVFTDGARES